LGPHLGLNLQNDEFLLGGTARIPLASAPIVLNPGVEFYPSIGTDISLVVLNFDVQYQLEAENFEPYVGGGISMARASVLTISDWEAGLNLKGGLLFNPTSSVRPYAEAVLNFAGGQEALIFKGGFLFTIGG
jgi:opacity protein-like surface antigen